MNPRKFHNFINQSYQFFILIISSTYPWVGIIYANDSIWKNRMIFVSGL